jgi:hypothetical protein
VNPDDIGFSQTDTGQFTINPTRRYPKIIGWVVVITLAVSIGGLIGNIIDNSHPDPPSTPVVAAAPSAPTTTTGDEATTTTTIDRDADCKAALQQTDDVNAPFTACTGSQYDRLLAVYGPGKPERRPACQYADMGPACTGIPVTTTTTRGYDTLRSVWNNVDINVYYTALNSHSDTLTRMSDDQTMALILWDTTLAPSYRRIATATATFIGDIQAAADTAYLGPSDRALMDRVIGMLRQVQSTNQAVGACQDGLSCVDRMGAANDAFEAASSVLAEINGAI